MRGQLAEGGRRIAADGSGPRRTAGDQACHRASHHAARLQESSCGESQRVLEQLGSPARDTPLAQEQRRGEGFSGAVVHDSPADKRVVATIPCERVRITSAVSLCAVALLCVGTLPIGLSATCWGTAPRGASPRTGTRRQPRARPSRRRDPASRRSRAAAKSGPWRRPVLCACGPAARASPCPLRPA